MSLLELDFSNYPIVGQSDAFEESMQRAQDAERRLRRADVEGRDFLGWMTLPTDMQGAELDRMKATADHLRKECDAVLMFGIGGSYLGAAALIEALPEQVSGPEIYFVGNSLCSDYLYNVLQKLEGRRVGVVVISKSGTTLEPAVALRIFMRYYEQSRGVALEPSHVVAITDAHRGALHDMAEAHGWVRYVVPDNVGGRYSVLSAVGLLPLLIAGVDVDALLRGAQKAQEEFLSAPLESSLPARYASARYYQYQLGHRVEVMVGYSPYLRGLLEWCKQLFAESEGKLGRGIFPTSAIFTTDLHSLGQYFQEGHRFFFATHMQFRQVQHDLRVPSDADNRDGLNYLAARTVHELNLVAQEATQQAHLEGGLPSLTLWIGARRCSDLGYLIYFLEYSCALSCICQAVPPFNQPGVEAYKGHMFSRLGRPAK